MCDSDDRDLCYDGCENINCKFNLNYPDGTEFNEDDAYYICPPHELFKYDIYSLVAVKKFIIDDEQLKTKMENFLNKDLKCEGSHLLKAPTEFFQEPFLHIDDYYVCVFVQMWG